MAGGTQYYEGSRQADKGKVTAVSISNVATLSDTQTVGGVALTDGELVLLTAQTTGTENGLWVCNADVAWTRPHNFKLAEHCANGATAFCAEGTYAGTRWALHTAAVTPGTTDHTWIQVDPAILTSQLDLVANTTTTSSVVVPENLTVYKIVTKARTAAASAAGTVTLAIAAGGNNLLSTATIDLETQSTTETTMTLTATSADLALSRADVIQTDVVSNNADATGGLDIVTMVYCIPTAP